MTSGRTFGLLGAAMGAFALASAVKKQRVSGAPQRSSRLLTSNATPPRRWAISPVVPEHILAARSLNRSAALLAVSVLSDSAMEHYRGAFSNPAMFTPLVSSMLSLIAGVHGGMDKTRGQHFLRHLVYGATGVVGLSGTAFHVYNVTKRPGGWSWDNLFHAAPVGAPAALMLSGALGALAERLRDEPDTEPQLLGLPAGTALGLFISAGLLGTAGEAALLHFRGAFQHKAMYAPVTVPPAAALVLASAAIAAPGANRVTQWWMKITMLLGFLGAGFHARGIARRQGGWRNWSQNLFSGPPLPAPPSFSALALAGLAALRLRRSES